MKGETMNQRDNDEIEIDLKEIFFLLLNRIWIIVATTVVFGVVAAVFTKAFITPVYSSQSMIYILTKTTSLTSLADIQLGSQLTADYEVLIKSRPVLEKVIENLKLNLRYDELGEKIVVTNDSDTRVLTITVNDPDKNLAKEIVDELTDVGCARIAEIMGTDPPNIVDYGHVAEVKTSPSTTKNTLVGAFAGFALSVVIIIIIFLMNDAIKTAEDVERYLGINTLGTIPLMEGTSKRASHGRDRDAARARRQKEKERRQRAKEARKQAGAGIDKE